MTFAEKREELLRSFETMSDWRARNGIKEPPKLKRVKFLKNESWYRVSDGRFYANIKRGSRIRGRAYRGGYSPTIHENAIKGENPRLWYADIHRCETGELVRYAGIWNTLKAAQEEVEDTISRL